MRTDTALVFACVVFLATFATGCSAESAERVETATKTKPG
jgi:hypothetical protein